MKHIYITVIYCVLLLLLSCCNDNIMDRAREFEAHTELNGIIRFYTRCYYEMPQQKSDIIHFLELYKSFDSSSFGSMYDIYSENRDFIGFLKKENMMVSAFKDSIFIFFPDFNLGCIEYGTPYYYLLYPERYAFMDYDEIFSSSAFRKNGDFYFDFNYKLLDSVINSIPNFYKSVILTHGYDNRFNWGNGGKPILVPMRIIATYDVAKDSLYRTSEFPVQNDSISFSNVVIKTDPDIPSDIYVTYDEDNVKHKIASNINLDSLSEDLLKSIAPKLKTIAQKDTLIGKIVFPIYLYLNTEQH